MLAADLEQPRLLISLFCAARVRLRRNYLLLVYFTTAVWLTKVYVHPTSPGSVGEFTSRLAVGNLIPPWFVVTTAAAFILVSTILALTCPTIEDLERWKLPSWDTDPFPLP